MTVRSAMSGTTPHQNDVQLPGRQVWFPGSQLARCLLPRWPSGEVPASREGDTGITPCFARSRFTSDLKTCVQWLSCMLGSVVGLSDPASIL